MKAMVRTSSLPHPQRSPASLRDAATILLLQDSPEGLQVLMTRRSEKAKFAPGAYVFPGGTLDPADARPMPGVQTRPTLPAPLMPFAMAAVRECFEELGVLLARDRHKAWLSQDAVAALERTGDFHHQCVQQQYSLALDGLFLLARWITDRDIPMRFDVTFWVARMPPGQTPLADEHEQFAAQWVRPADALERHRQGAFAMVYPTIKTLAHLAQFSSVDAVLQACAVSEEPLWTSCPRAGFLGGQEARYMEHEPPYGELELVCPDGQLLHPLDWQHERPVFLLKHVQRLTAPNPGIMTGPGTNTYCVGEAATGFIVIDPGPADAKHGQRIVEATGGDIRAIVCTHSHADHSPGALPLQAACAHRPPILGLASGPEARPSARFVPDRPITDAEVLQLKDAQGRTRHSLQLLHTPGHAANHVCVVLMEDGLLFSGDHILNGSTTVIDPPDGHMGDYLASLDKLSHACLEQDIGFILPAHGHVLGQASAAITKLKAHRLAREAKVAQAMDASPDGTVDEWVAQAYADTPTALWPVARRSLLAHVAHIRESRGLIPLKTPNPS